MMILKFLLSISVISPLLYIANSFQMPDDGIVKVVDFRLSVATLSVVVNDAQSDGLNTNDDANQGMCSA
jgi:hypothetical protein